MIFAVAAHRQPLRVLSLSVSIASLSLSPVNCLSNLSKAEELAWKDYAEEDELPDIPSEDKVVGCGSLSEENDDEESSKLVPNEDLVRKKIREAATRTQARISEKRKSRQSQARRTLREGDGNAPDLEGGRGSNSLQPLRLNEIYERF